MHVVRCRPINAVRRLNETSVHWGSAGSRMAQKGCIVPNRQLGGSACNRSKPTAWKHELWFLGVQARAPRRPGEGVIRIMGADSYLAAILSMVLQTVATFIPPFFVIQESSKRN